MRSIKPDMSLNNLGIVYYSNFNSIKNYGLPFWGNSSHSINIFRMQKNKIKIMLACKKRVSCGNLSRKLKILTLVSQYILSLMLFMIKNKNQFIGNLEIQCRYQTTYKLSSTYTKSDKIWEGIYYSGVRVYNNLPLHIKDIYDDPKILNFN